MFIVRRAFTRRSITVAPRALLSALMFMSVATLSFALPAGATTNTPPDPPTGLTATINYSVAGTATLNWTDPTNPGTYNGSPDTITGYNVWVSDNGGAYVANGTCEGASTSSCLIFGLNADDYYTFELTTETQNLQVSSDSIASTPITLPSASTISLNTVSNAAYDTPVTLTATANTPGNVEFALNGFDITGCSSVATTSSSPYVATCSWTPTAPESSSIRASFTPQYSLSYTDSTTTESITVSPGIPTVSLTGYTGAVYGTASPLEYTANVPGAVEFKSGGVDITGCSSVATNGAGPFTATCSWTPSTVGATSIEAIFTSYDFDYSGADTGVLSTSVAQAAQPTLSVTSTSGDVGAPLDLTSSGGEGINPVTYSVVDGSASGCTVSVSMPYALTATSAGTCVVTASELGDTDYLTATSAPTIVTLSAPAAIPQSALIVTSVSGEAGTPLTLATSGGDGDGPVTYSVVDGTASGCAVSATTPYVLTATGAGTCVVTATKAGESGFQTAVSPPTTITFTSIVQAPLVVVAASGSVGTRLKLATTGGSGTGAITYNVTDGTASGCAVSATAPYVLTATSAGTCVVTATQASTTSSPSTLTLEPVVVSARVDSVTSTTYDVSLNQRGLSPGARLLSNAPGVRLSVAGVSLRDLSMHLAFTARARPGTYVLRVIDRNGTAVTVYLRLIVVGGKIVPRIDVK